MPSEPGSLPGAVQSLSGKPGSSLGRQSNRRNITVDTASTLILSPNPQRIFATIVNNGNHVVHIALGEDAIAGDPGVLHGGTFVIDADHPWTGAVYGIADDDPSDCGGSEVSGHD